MFNITIVSNIIPGGLTSSSQVGGVLIESELIVGPTIISDLTAGVGLKGDKGDTGGTGGIVPITVSVSAPSSPNVNDLWIDLS